MPWEVRRHPTTPLGVAGHPAKAMEHLLLVLDLAAAYSLLPDPLNPAPAQQVHQETVAQPEGVWTLDLWSPRAFTETGEFRGCLNLRD